MKNALKPLWWYACAIMTTYQHISINLGNFEIVSIWPLFGPETAVPDEEQSWSETVGLSQIINRY